MDAMPVAGAGRRYEVAQVTETGKHVWGWSDAEDGGALARSAGLHPETLQVQVFDQREAFLRVYPPSHYQRS